MEAFGETNVGRMRKSDQDYMFYSVNPVGSLPNLFVVADGMGGHNAGEYASWFTVETLVRLIRDSAGKEPCRIIEESIQEVNKRLFHKSYEDIEMSGMGTTLTLATVIDSVLYVANVGDSRTYLIGEEIRQISQDHSYVEEMVQEGLIERGSEEYFRQKNIITRAIGASEPVRADFFEVNLNREAYLLLCSDGLTNMVEDDEIKNIVMHEGDVEEHVHNLIHKANTNGGRDNIAVVLVDLD